MSERSFYKVLFTTILSLCLSMPSFANYSVCVDTTILDYQQKIQEIQAEGYYVKKGLPTGYIRDGTADYTSYIQKVLDIYKVVVFPAFPILIDSVGLTIHSHSKIYFPPGSVLIMKPNGRAKYEMLRLDSVQNVSIYCPNLEGDRSGHFNNKGEWGMGVSIKSSSDVNIFSPVISQCWGDAIYVGASSPGGFCKNILIYAAVCDSNRRNGISIVSAENLKLINAKVTHTYGTNPMSGIDIEPNTDKDTINDILIENAYTAYNMNAGIAIGLSGFLGARQKEVNIAIIKAHDKASGIGLQLGPLPVSRYNFLAFKKMKGNIMIKNPLWEDNSKLPLSAFKYGSFGPLVEIINPTSIQHKKANEELVKKYFPEIDEQNIKVIY